MINCADLIRSDIVLKSFDGRVCDSSEIQNRKNFVKHQIYTILDGKTIGKSIFIETNEFDFTLPCLLAIWELGCNIFVHDSFTTLSKIPEFKSFWDFISITITDNKTNIDGLQIPTIYTNKYNNGIVYPTEFLLDQEITSDTVAVKTHSSGTTGFPKLVDFTHKLVIDRVKNHIQWDKMDQMEQRPIHFKTLHHGSLFVEFALPLLALGQEHHWISGRTFIGEDRYTGKEFLEKVLPYLKEHRITKMMILYDWIDAFKEVTPVNLNGVISFCCFKGPSNDSARCVIEKFNPKEIINMFGCSELGTMFQSRCTKENYQTYASNDFSEVASGLEYKIYPDHIEARWPGFPWYSLSDLFEEHNGIVSFRRRMWSVTVNGTTVFLNDLEQFLEKYYQTRDFTIAPNFETGKIYLAVYDKNIPVDIDAVNKAITRELSARHQLEGIKYFDVYSVISGIKPTGTLILHSFRNNKE